MKYWLLTTEYPPLFGGGISTYCYHTARMLSEKGHDVTVFINDDDIEDYLESEKDGIRIIRFNSYRSRLENYLGHIARLGYEFAIIVRDIIRKYGKPDCIESQEYLAIPYYILQFKLLQYQEFSNVPVIVTLHSPAFLYLHYNREGTYQFPNFWTCEMEMSCIRCADWIVAPSKYIVDEIKKHLPIDKENVTVIRNPYYFADRDFIRPALKRDKIVFYGKLSPQKGVFELFAYFKELWDNGFPHSLIVIGGTDKVYYPEMKTMKQVLVDKYETYEKKGLFEFVGKIAPSKKEEYLSDAHVILIPSMNDNLPYACIEAMGMGKTVLASQQGGQSEIIEDGKSGFLFSHEQPETFAEKLRHILSLDTEVLHKVGETAAESVRDILDIDRIYRQKMEVVDRIGSRDLRSDVFTFTRASSSVPLLPQDHYEPGLLSIVIPYYNMGAYIRECITSIQSSAYNNIEILLVDDGSTERESIDALMPFEQYPNIRVFRKKNEGLADTRNYGAKMAKGEFIAFLDADDKVHPDYYTKSISVLRQYRNVFFVGCWVQYFDRKSDIWITWNPEPPYILVHNSVNSSSLVYKKAAFLAAGLNDKKTDYGLEDYESVISMLHHGYNGVVLPEPLFYYRIRPKSMYRQITREKLLYSNKYIAEKHAGYYAAYAYQLVNILNANGPGYSFDNPTFGMKVTSVRENRLFLKLKFFIKKHKKLKEIALTIKKIKSTA